MDILAKKKLLGRQNLDTLAKKKKKRKKDGTIWTQYLKMEVIIVTDSINKICLDFKDLYIHWLILIEDYINHFLLNIRIL